MFKRRRLQNCRRLIQSIALLLVAIGIAGVAWGVRLYSERPRPPAPAFEAAMPLSAKPSPQAMTSYTVAPDAPKYIGIPALNLAQARVIRLGLLKNGEIATPANIYDTGWYNASARPGQPGAMFIFGHVSSWQANGVFHNLSRLRPGSKIVVTRGDNQTFTYQVAASKVYPYNQVDMRQVLSPIEPKRPGLNLMTCAGQVIKGTSDFNERLVVFASLVAP